MPNTQDWVEALNISPENLAEWSQSVPAETPLLVWCLENGHVSATDYFAWARENYGLPTLNAHFFANADLKVLKDVVTQGDWTPWFFPVAQWEDVTLVGCVEPPAELPEGNMALVLSEPGPLRQLWNSANPSTGTGVKINPNTDTKTNVPLSQLDAPVGINLNRTSSFQLNLDALEPGTSPSVAAPPGLEDDLVDSPPDLELTGKSGITLSLVAENPDPAPPRLPPTTPEASQEMTEESVPIKTMPKAETPVGTKTTITPATTIKPVTPVKPAAAIASTAEEETEIKVAFDRLKHLYKYALLMRCVEGFAKPFRWDNDLKIANADDCSVSLAIPNFLRIVAKTTHLYHGYVVDSPVHRQFFQSLGLATNPECVTAIPIRSGDQMWGILVALGTETAHGNDALEACQTIAEKLVAVLTTHSAKAS